MSLITRESTNLSFVCDAFRHLYYRQGSVPTLCLLIRSMVDGRNYQPDDPHSGYDFDIKPSPNLVTIECRGCSKHLSYCQMSCVLHQAVTVITPEYIIIKNANEGRSHRRDLKFKI